MKLNYIFVVGVGRSGTSLLQSMLHAHAAVAFLPETKFLREYVFHQGKRQFASDIEKKDLVRRLSEDEKFSRTKVDPQYIVQSSNSYEETYFNLLATAATPTIQYVGDKDPRFLDFLPNLRDVAPASKIIHIIRDPREVVLSRTKADWSKHWPFFMHATMYYTQLERGRKLGRKCFGSNYMEFYYEDLLKDPRRVLTSICDFLGIDFSASMLNFGESAKMLVDEKEMQWKKETLGPLLTDNSEKWKTSLTEEQIFIVQQVCNPAFQKHPYKKIIIKPTMIMRVKTMGYVFFSKIFKIVYPLRLRFLK